MNLKGKKTTYFLLPVVLLIWGMVIIRIFFHGSEDIQREPQALADVIEREKNNAPDTFSLSLDYPDPFLKRNVVVYRKVAVKKKPAPKKEKKRKIKWPSVAYGGMIKNQASDLSLAMVKVAGKDKLLQEGDAIGLLQIDKIYADSIRVSYESNEKIILK